MLSTLAESIEKIIMDTTNCLCGFWKHRAELEITFPKGIPYGFPVLVDLAKHLVRESFQEPYQVTLHVLPNDLASLVCSRVATTFERMLLLLQTADCTEQAFTTATRISKCGMLNAFLNESSL